MFKSKIYYALIIIVLLLSISCKTKQLAHDNKSPSSEGLSDQKFIDYYSKHLGVPLEQGCNQRFILAIAKWINTPYAYGQNTLQGTDCSGLVQNLYLEVYNIQLEHNAHAQWQQAKALKESDLREGDLVFFKINTSHVGHVGLYINKGYFVHSSSKKGVIISNLEEKYYRTYYFSSGRITK